MRFISRMVLTIVLISAVFAAGCLSDSIDNDFDTDIPSNGIFVATTDWLAAGMTAVIHGDPPTKVDLPATQISTDPVARYYNERVYVINRMGFDNIQVLNPYHDYVTEKQYSTGNGSNPQDIAFASGKKAFISRYGNSALRIVKPRSGSKLGSVELAAYADADGLPEPAKMLVVGDRLFVALQRLDSAAWYVPTDKSTIAVINTTDNSVVATVDLATTNPVTDLLYDDVASKVYVGCAGEWKFNDVTADGGVESISVDFLTDTYTADGVVIDEATLGGDIGSMVMVADDQFYAIVSDASFTNYLIRFDPTNPGAGVTVVWTTFSYIPAIAVNANEYIFVADTDFVEPGVRVWDSTTDTEITTEPIDVGMPPVALTVLK